MGECFLCPLCQGVHLSFLSPHCTPSWGEVNQWKCCEHHTSVPWAPASLLYILLIHPSAGHRSAWEDEAKKSKRKPLLDLFVDSVFRRNRANFPPSLTIALCFLQNTTYLPYKSKKMKMWNLNFLLLWVWSGVTVEMNGNLLTSAVFVKHYSFLSAFHTCH